MKTHVRVLVIGGGVVGVSTLYHLAKKGWTDVALLERTKLVRPHHHVHGEGVAAAGTELGATIARRGRGRGCGPV